MDLRKKFLEYTNGFQAGYIVWNNTYLNPTQKDRHWYTPTKINNVVHVQYVFADNIKLKNLLCPSNFQKLATFGRPR